MCTDSEERLWRAGLFGATIVLVGPSHRRAVGQDQVPSPSHDCFRGVGWVGVRVGVLVGVVGVGGVPTVSWCLQC